DAKALVTVSDICDASPTLDCFDGGIVPNGCQRSQTFTVTATDLAGNVSAACNVTYIWTEDATPPSLICLGNKIVECGSPWTFDPPNASDSCGSVAVSIVSTVTNTTGHCGNTFDATRTWEATDQCNNTSTTCSQTVTVIDTTPPAITCVGDKNVECTS